MIFRDGYEKSRNTLVSVTFCLKCAILPVAKSNGEPSALTDKKPPKTAAERQAAYRARKQERAPAPEAEPPGGILAAKHYQQQVQDLEAQVRKLEAEKLRLYDLLEVAQANVQREQTLRLLPGPVADRGSGLAWRRWLSQWFGGGKGEV